MSVHFDSAGCSREFILGYSVCVRVLSHFSVVQLSVTLWTVARLAPMSVEFSRQECWSRLPFPSLGNLPDQEFNLLLLLWQADSLSLSHQGSPASSVRSCISENIFITPSHLINSFAGYRILPLEIFFLQDSEAFIHCLLSSYCCKVHCHSDSWPFAESMFSFSSLETLSIFSLFQCDETAQWCVLVNQCSSVVLNIIGKFRVLISEFSWIISLGNFLSLSLHLLSKFGLDILMYSYNFISSLLYFLSVFTTPSEYYPWHFHFSSFQALSFVLWMIFIRIIFSFSLVLLR